jgi:hypothetical protein
MKNIEKSSGEFRFTSYVKHYFVLLMNLDQFKLQKFHSNPYPCVGYSQFLSSQNYQNYGWKWADINILTHRLSKSN